MWIFVYLTMLGAVTVRVRYTDGMEINLIGWLDVLLRKRGEK